MARIRGAVPRLLLSLGLVGVAGSVAPAQSITGLGFLPGGSRSYASGISSDGSVVVGQATTSSFEGHAFRWTRSGGMQDLGAPPAGQGYYRAAHATNSDGSVVVGTFGSSSGARAFRWTSAGGAEELGTFPGGTQSSAYGVSRDGSIIVGFATDAKLYQLACSWTSDGGIQSLGTLPGENNSFAEDVSADGSVVVGRSWSGDPTRAFRWTSAGGMQDLGLLSGQTDAYATVVSADGSVVFGLSYTDLFDGFRCFRWTSAEGMQDVGVLPNGSRTSVNAVSGDGSVAVGGALDLRGDERAVLWNSTEGLVDLNAYLPATFGINLAGWTLVSADGISADGMTMTGTGAHNGLLEAWVIIIPCLHADFNHDFVVNSQDFFDFLFPFFAADPAADFNGDGTVNSADFFAFLDSFIAGCP